MMIWLDERKGNSLMKKKILAQRAIEPGRKNMMSAKTAMNTSPMSEK